MHKTSYNKFSDDKQEQYETQQRRNFFDGMLNNQKYRE